jgi:hypothetical protein
MRLSDIFTRTGMRNTWNKGGGYVAIMSVHSGAGNDRGGVRVCPSRDAGLSNDFGCHDANGFSSHADARCPHCHGDGYSDSCAGANADAYFDADRYQNGNASFHGRSHGDPKAPADAGRAAAHTRRDPKQQERRL